MRIVTFPLLTLKVFSNLPTVLKVVKSGEPSFHIHYDWVSHTPAGTCVDD